MRGDIDERFPIDRLVEGLAHHQVGEPVPRPGNVRSELDFNVLQRVPLIEPDHVAGARPSLLNFGRRVVFTKDSGKAFGG